MAQEIADRASIEPEEVAPQGRPAGPTVVALRRLLRKKIAVCAIAFIIVFYSIGILAPALTATGIIPSYTKQDLSQSLDKPSRAHPFGTDRLGRDQLSRTVWAAQTTVIITVITLLFGGLFLTVSLGLLSGYAGGWIDTLITRVGDIFACLPGLLMMILINATLKNQAHAVGADVERLTGISGIVKSGAPDYILVFGVLSLFGWAVGARIIRSQVLALRETEFVLAARATGASTPRILFRHLLPNVSNMLIVSLSLSLAGIAGSEIALTWFGVGIQPPHPSFGAMLSDPDAISTRGVNANFYLLLFPGLIVSGLFFAFNLLGDALTDVFTPRAR